MCPSELVCFRCIYTVHKGGKNIIIIMIIIKCALLHYLHRFKHGLTRA